MHFMKKAAAALCLTALLGTSAAIPAAAADSGADILKTADFYLTFEDGIKDDMGRYEFKADGEVPAVDGRFGKGIATDSADHYVYSDDVEFGTDSWTLTAWVRIDEHSGDQVLFGNKDWNSGGNPGWLITPRDGDWKINGNPGSRFDFQYSYKDSVLKSEKDNWYHLAISVDRGAGTLAFYINGVPVLDTYSIAEYGDGDLDGITFTMGQDGTGVYGDGTLKAAFDEVALFRRALTAEEIAAVYTYAPDGYEPAQLVTKDAAGGGKSSDPAPAIGAENGYVTDGLQIYYDGANNTGAGQDKNSTVWRDVSGNGYDFSVSLDGENRWTDKSYYIDSTANYFPDKVKDIANGDQYTIELALGEIEQPGTNWISLIISDNDEFSLFVRVENDNLEFKYNDNNRDRPVAEDGAELVNDSTVAVTFDIEDQDCFLYVDGELLYEAVPLEVNHANYMHLGSEDAKRNWLGDVYAIRFYDRELTPEEIARNAAADNARFRGGPAVTPVSAGTDAAPAAESATLTIQGFDYKDCGDNANEILQYGSEDPTISTSIPLKPLDGATAEGAWFDFDITTVDAGDVEFTFLYAASGDRYMDVNFNGETRRVVCPDTGNFQTFDKTSVTFSGVPAGTGTLRLAAPSDYSDSVKTPNVDVIYVTGPVDASAAPAAAEPAAAELLNKSWDTIFVDYEMMVDGNAGGWLAENPVEGPIGQLEFRGWTYLSTPIKGFAYTIDGGEAVRSEDFIQDRPDVKAAIAEEAEGFDIEIEVDSLTAGEHVIRLFAVDANDALVDTTFEFPFTKEAAPEKEPEPEPEPADEPVSEPTEPAEEPAADAPAAEEPAADAPAADAPAVSEPESPAPAPAKGGCGSMIGGSFIVLTAILGAAWVSKRR